MQKQVLTDAMHRPGAVYQPNSSRLSQRAINFFIKLAVQERRLL